MHALKFSAVSHQLGHLGIQRHAELQGSKINLSQEAAGQGVNVSLFSVAAPAHEDELRPLKPDPVTFYFLSLDVLIDGAFCLSILDTHGDASAGTQSQARLRRRRRIKQKK